MKVQIGMIEAATSTRNLNEWISRLLRASKEWLKTLSGTIPVENYPEIIFTPTVMEVNTNKYDYTDYGVIAYDLASNSGIRGSITSPVVLAE